MARTVSVKIESVSPYSQSRRHDTEKLPGEKADDYETRTWRDRVTTDANGNQLIPGMAFKMALDSAAKRLSMKIPGKRNSTYTKHFVGGVICTTDMPTGYKKAEIPGVSINANADGVRGSGKRVKRILPQITKYTGTIEFVVLDDAIDKPIFEQTLREAGQSVGIGQFRPENGGLNGRFVVKSFDWQG
jgi:hypothetical protein